MTQPVVVNIAHEDAVPECAMKMKRMLRANTPQGLGTLEIVGPKA